jgi:hypothetical protein
MKVVRIIADAKTGDTLATFFDWSIKGQEQSILMSKNSLAPIKLFFAWRENFAPIRAFPGYCDAFDGHLKPFG